MCKSTQPLGNSRMGCYQRKALASTLHVLEISWIVLVSGYSTCQSIGHLPWWIGSIGRGGRDTGEMIFPSPTKCFQHSLAHQLRWQMMLWYMIEVIWRDKANLETLVISWWHMHGGQFYFTFLVNKLCGWASPFMGMVESSLHAFAHKQALAEFTKEKASPRKKHMVQVKHGVEVYHL